MKNLSILALLCLHVAAQGCAGSTGKPQASQEARSPAVLHDDLGSLHRPITTSSPEAGRWFDQGLTLIFAFNHDEAKRSFEEASRRDPQCAMAFWGKALAAGPHINNPSMDAAASRAASEDARRAQSLSANATPVERDLIAALAKRYVEPPPDDRKMLDRAYADGMREVHRSHPDDLDVAVLFAESLMDLRPWDLWTQEGQPQPETPEIVSLLEAVLAKNPDHPGANHYYIHTLEASPGFARALPSADRLGALVPGASHLVHMPAHIYQRLGRYADAVTVNQNAAAVDRKRLPYTGTGGFYALYRAHNVHFLVWAAMYDGRRALAQSAARDLLEIVPLNVVESMPDVLEGFLATPLHVSIRFGLWDEILREPKPKSTLPLTTAFWRYARAVAFSASGKLDDAAAEASAFEIARKAVPGSANIGNNSAASVLEIARAMLDGELSFRRGALEPAFARLRDGVRLEDALRYDEPWDWVQPVRHSLGALLLQAGRVQEAEGVYLDDLKRHPENGWSLHGLAECLRRRGDPNAAAVDARFRTAWSRSDVKLPGSCFCRTN